MVTRTDVVEAARRIAGCVHRTPVLTSRTIDAMLGAEIHFKCENLQRVGAFKIRGATNAVRSLPADTEVVATHSSGIMKIVVEPSGAVTLAAVAENPDVARGRVGVVLSGGNALPEGR